MIRTVLLITLQQLPSQVTVAHINHQSTTVPEAVTHPAVEALHLVEAVTAVHHLAVEAVQVAQAVHLPAVVLEILMEIQTVLKTYSFLF